MGTNGGSISGGIICLLSIVIAVLVTVVAATVFQQQLEAGETAAHEKTYKSSEQNNQKFDSMEELLSFERESHNKTLQLLESYKEKIDHLEELVLLGNQQQQGRSADKDKIMDYMIETQTDKYSTHRYDYAYQEWLEPFRTMPNFRMVEIGAEKGKSLALWANYFEQPQLILGLAYGVSATGVEEKVETENFAKRNKDKLKVIRGDQSRKDTMDEICSYGPFDVIIDDGSHVPWHMVYSFVHLFPCLKEDGLYIIEDVETNYWDTDSTITVYDQKFPKAGIGSSPAVSAVEKFKQLIDVINRHELCRPELTVLPGDDMVCEASFQANVIKIRKCTKERAEEYKKRNCLRWKYKNNDQAGVHKWMAEAQSTNGDFGNITIPAYGG